MFNKKAFLKHLEMERRYVLLIFLISNCFSCAGSSNLESPGKYNRTLMSGIDACPSPHITASGGPTTSTTVLVLYPVSRQEETHLKRFRLFKKEEEHEDEEEEGEEE